MAGGCASSGAGTWLHALGAARRSMRASALTAVLYLTLALAGAATGGAVGTIRGAALGTWIGSLLYWWQVRAARRDSRNALTGDRSSASLQNGQHGTIPEPARKLPLDLTVPPDPVARSAAFTPVAAEWSSPPTPALRPVGKHPPSRTAAMPSAPIAVQPDPVPWAAAFSPAATSWSLLPTLAGQDVEDRTAAAAPGSEEPAQPLWPEPPWREKMPHTAPGSRERRIRRRVGLTWGLLVLNALTLHRSAGPYPVGVRQGHYARSPAAGAARGAEP